VASFDIGAKLRQERLGQGLSIASLSGETRIPSRFLEAIEADDFGRLPGLVFTRNFVRQYALSLKLDPDPLLAELPKQDASTVQLPDPPARRRSSFQSDRATRSLISSLVWTVVGVSAGYAAYLHFNHTLKQAPPESSRVQIASSAPQQAPILAPPPIDAAPTQSPAPAAAKPAVQAAPQGPVEVSMTARQPAWVEITADGKPAYTGTMQSNETREITAAEQVKILTGNAGGLSISLNGKPLDPLGPPGQIRSVKLTAEGPQPLANAPHYVPPDPLL